MISVVAFVALQKILTVVASVNEPNAKNFPVEVAERNFKSCSVDVNVSSVKYVNRDVNAFSVIGELGQNRWLNESQLTEGKVYELTGEKFTTLTGRYGWLRVIRYKSRPSLVSILANTLGPAPKSKQAKILDTVLQIEKSFRK